MSSTLHLILKRGIRELSPEIVGDNITTTATISTTSERFNGIVWNNSSTTTEEEGGEDIQVDDDDAFYEASKVALILPRITAAISLFAVICVATEAWQDLKMEKKSKQKRNNVVQHGNRIRSNTAASNVSTITNIQLWYQLPLFCHALAFALGTTPAPEELSIWGAVGNTATCEAQGFVLQFGIFGVVGWDVALSTAYLMMVRYLVADFRLQSWEKYYHIIIWPSVLVICIIPLVKDMYNFNHSVCWLESYPNDCIDDECIRGNGAAFWQTLASFAGVLHLVYSITVMVCIYCSIRGLEDRRNQRFSSSFELSTPTSSFTAARAPSHRHHVVQQSRTRTRSGGDATMMTMPNRPYSRAVGIQGMLYSSGMIITTLPTAIYIVLWNLTGLWSPAFGIFATSMTPLMGYVNFIVFMRNRKVSDCRTRYGRFLRRAHSWVWDYRLFCRCHCRCLPKYVGSESGGDTASTSAPHPISTEQWVGPSNTTRKGRPFSSKTTITTPLPIIQEEAADVESGEESKLICGAWEIALNRQEPTPLTMSELVDSEHISTYALGHGEQLGTSGDSQPGFWRRQEAGRPSPVRPAERHKSYDVSGLSMAEFDSSSIVAAECDDSGENDAAPTKPIRFTSQVELPPARPEHLESCVSELVGASDVSTTIAQNDCACSPTDDFAPTQPLRLASCAELPPAGSEQLESRVSAGLGVSSDVSVSSSESEHIIGDVAPVQPYRLASQVELSPTKTER